MQAHTILTVRTSLSHGFSPSQSSISTSWQYELRISLQTMPDVLHFAHSADILLVHDVVGRLLTPDAVSRGSMHKDLYVVVNLALTAHQIGITRLQRIPNETITKLFETCVPLGCTILYAARQHCEGALRYCSPLVFWETILMAPREWLNVCDVQPYDTFLRYRHETS